MDENNVMKELASIYCHENPNSDYNRTTFFENSIILYPPYTIHNKIHKSNSEVIAFVFNTDNKIDINRFMHFPHVSEKIKDLIILAMEEYKGKNPFYVEKIELLLGEIIIELMRSAPTHSPNDKTMSISQAVKFVNDYFLDNIDFESLAKSCGYSIDRFRHIFKQHTGLSPKNFLLQKKMDLAVNQLVLSDMKIINISDILGYTDFFQFSSYFKKRFGLSPRDYRIKYRKK